MDFLLGPLEKLGLQATTFNKMMNGWTVSDLQGEWWERELGQTQAPSLTPAFQPCHLSLSFKIRPRRLREWTYGCRWGGMVEGGWEEGIVREFGMDMYTLLYFKWITNRDLPCIEHGTLLLKVTWQPGWEGSLGANGHMCIYGWVPSLFTWNHHKIVC